MVFDTLETTHTRSKTEPIPLGYMTIRKNAPFSITGGNLGVSLIQLKSSVTKIFLHTFFYATIFSDPTGGKRTQSNEMNRLKANILT